MTNGSMTSQSTILIVDDEQAVVDALRNSLEKAHYRVLVARDGEQALDLAERGSPDLLVLDLMLPSSGWRSVVPPASVRITLAGGPGTATDGGAHVASRCGRTLCKMPETRLPS